nr:unnamed protein product [Callosobruchus analis]
MEEHVGQKKPPDKDNRSAGMSSVEKTLTYNSYDIKYYKYGDTSPFMIIVESLNMDVANMHPIKLGRKLQKADIRGIQCITRKGKNRVGIEFSSPKSANNFIDSKFLKEENLHAFIPNSLVTSRGVVRGIPEDMTPEEIIQCAKTEQKVVHARRINRRQLNEDRTVSYVKTSTVVLIFEGKKIPKHVDLSYFRVKVNVYIPL